MTRHAWPSRMPTRLPRFSLTALLVAALATILAVAPESRAATNAEIDAAIARGKKFLYSQMKVKGRWEKDAKRDPKQSGHQWEKMQGDSFGGYTAIATYALLACGESPQKEEMKAAIDFLQK